MALARTARLAVSHIATLERGEVQPRPATFRRIALALKLGEQECEEFRHVAAADRAPDGPVSLCLWSYLPASLFTVSHPEIWPFELAADDWLVDMVRAVGSLLGCLALAMKPPTRVQVRRLRGVAQLMFDNFRRFADEHPILGASDPLFVASDVATALPRAWRNEVFASRANVARLVDLLREWAYFPSGFQGPARLGAWLRDERLNSTYSFGSITPESVIRVHNALVAHRLWSLLDLTSAFGVTGQSVQEYDLAVQLSPYNGDLSMLLRARADDPTIAGDAAGAWERRDELRAAAERVDLALRLYELPDLAQRVLQVPRAEVEAGLTRAVDLVGGVSARFPGPPVPAAPKSD